MTSDALPDRYYVDKPDSVGMWWFTGKVLVPHSTTPGNATTVHVETPRRFEVISSEWGMFPTEPANGYPYADCTFIGKWLKSL